MENQDGQNHAIQQLVEQKQQGVISAYAIPQPDMQVFSRDPIDYCDLVQ